MAAWPDRAIILLVFAVLVLVLGCGGPPPRIPIQGTITYKNIPLEEGTLHFSPEDGSTGILGVAAVVDGKYAFPADKGLIPGKYQVSILKTSLSDSDGHPGGPRRNRELSTDKPTIEVTPTGSREFDLHFN